MSLPRRMAFIVFGGALFIAFLLGALGSVPVTIITAPFVGGETL